MNAATMRPRTVARVLRPSRSPPTFVNDMRFWNFVVNCVALPVNSTVYAGSQGPHANGPGAAPGTDRYRLAPAQNRAPQPAHTRPDRPALRVVN